jgi:hypothetical protein
MPTSTVHLGFFYMPQICDMGPTALLSFRRKACWGFFLDFSTTTLLKDMRAVLSSSWASLANYWTERSMSSTVVGKMERTVPLYLRLAVFKVTGPKERKPHNCQAVLTFPNVNHYLPNAREYYHSLLFRVCMISVLMCLTRKQDRQCTYNATLWRVRVTIVSVLT